jgi:DeoR/GlpR family transcriptional regulator of sugar metabolism
MSLMAQERYRVIVEHVARHGRARLVELQSRLGISSASLRRDVTELETRGQVVRVHGGVMHPAHVSEPSLAMRQRQARPAKAAIAEAAAALVQPGQTAFIDAGSTCLLVGRRLAARRDVTLITHSLSFAAAAVGGEASILVIGGRVRSISGALVGAEAIGVLDRLSADWAFLGASGLSAEGVSTPELEESAIKQAFLRRARWAVVCADAGKWDHPAAVRFARWKEIDQWVVDAEANKPAVRAVRRQGVEVRIVSRRSR